MIRDVYRASALGTRIFWASFHSTVFSAIAMPGNSAKIAYREGFSDIPLKLIGDLLAQVFSAAGPVYVKFGQILSTRQDLLPAEICERLEHLLDQHKPLAYRVIHKELAKRFKDWPFQSLEKKPIGVGSIGQVHFGVLKSGEAVAVKILRPGVGKRVKRDLGELKSLARIIGDYYPMSKETRKSVSFLLESFVQDLSVSLEKECDFSFELDNLKEFRQRFRKKKNVVVPQVFEDYCSSEVLVMERIDGVPLQKIKKDRSDSERVKLAEQYFQEILSQIFEEGHFHADPHAGNILVLNDGRLAMIDLGLTGSLGTRERSIMNRAVKAFSLRDPNALIESLLEFGSCGPKFDLEKFKTDIQQAVMGNKEKATRDLGAFVQELFKMAYQHEIYIPQESALLIKTLVTLEGVTKSLDPKANLARMAAPIVLKALTKRWLRWPFA